MDDAADKDVHKKSADKDRPMVSCCQSDDIRFVVYHIYKRNADSHPLSLWRATDSNQKLDIYVHDVQAVLNASDSDGWSNFSFCTNGTEYVRFDGLNKYVGIGTTSPAYKLDVNGDVRADNFIGNFANKSVTASTLK